MPDDRLPPELVALIHNIELADSAWWDTTVQRFIIATIWLSGAVSIAELVNRVAESVGISIDSTIALRQLEALVAAGDVVESATGVFRLSESATRQVEEDQSEAERQRQAVQGRFVQALAEEGVEGDPESVWTEFEATCLIPILREFGARTFELLDTSGSSGKTPDIQTVIRRQLAAKGERYRRAVVAFLDPGNRDVREYVLRSLNAYFLAQAAGLSASTLDALATGRSRHRDLGFFIDTNFLFSILRLHDNPANDVAEALDALLARVRDRLNVKLYVSPITLEEIKRVLSWEIDRFAGLTVSASVAQAVAGSHTLTGLTQRFIAEAARSTKPIGARDFFGPYMDDLIPILRRRGVDLFNENVDVYRTDQVVIDDLHEEEAYQAANRMRGAKPYDTNLHDMVLWHFIKGKRPAVTESPLDATYWIVTGDYGFVGFDRHKSGHSLPLCLDPAGLVQLLQFWVPRDEDLDRALVGSMRLPFLVLAFDAEAEKATTRILTTMSRFQDVGDIDDETLAKVLMNQALRQRIGEVKDEAEADALLREAFVEENRELADEVKRQRDRADQAETVATEETRALEARLQHLSAALEASKQRAEEVAAANEELLEKARKGEAERSDLVETVDKLSEVATSAESSARKTKLGLLSIVALFVVIAILGGICWIGALNGVVVPWPSWLVVLAAGAVGLIVWAVIVELVAKRQLAIQQSPFLERVSRWRKGLIAVAVAVIASVLGSAIWSSIHN
jgi:hypothetical protein